MPRMFVNDGSNVQLLTQIHVKDGNEVRKLTKLFVDDNGSQRQVFEPLAKYVIEGEGAIGDTETVDFQYSGTRSNVITLGEGAKEVVDFGLDNDFDAGIAIKEVVDFGIPNTFNAGGN